MAVAGIQLYSSVSAYQWQWKAFVMRMEVTCEWGKVPKQQLIKFTAVYKKVNVIWFYEKKLRL